MSTSTHESVLPVISYQEASPELQAVFDQIKKSFGRIPNLYASIGNSVTALTSNLAFDSNLAKGEFSPVEQEVIKLAASQANECQYCIAAHSAVLTMHNVGEDEILNVRRRTVTNPKHAAIANLAYEITETRGRPAQEHLDAFFAAGYDRAALMELIGIIALNTMNNYAHLIGDAEVDFPTPPALS